LDPNTFPTKGNLLLTRNSLELATQGYELLDRKRNILIHELMELINKATDIQSQIDVTFRDAYAKLQRANIHLGINFVQDIAKSIPVEDTVRIKIRSIMGTDIPLVEMDERDMSTPYYALNNTNEFLDQACVAFEKVKHLTAELAMMENAIYRLATNIKKTQKRANALKNITIPNLEGLAAKIQVVLEEKEREDFTRLKVIKRRMG